MTAALHHAAMAARRFHNAALAYLDDPTEERMEILDRVDDELMEAHTAYFLAWQQANC